MPIIAEYVICLYLVITLHKTWQLTINEDRTFSLRKNNILTQVYLFLYMHTMFSIQKNNDLFP